MIFTTLLTIFVSIGLIRCFTQLYYSYESTIIQKRLDKKRNKL